MMAVWLHEDSNRLRPELLNALRTAAAIDEATSEISRTLPLPAPMRIGAGLNTGTAIVGGSEYTALGDTVNAAFRLEAATKALGLGVALGGRTSSELSLEAESLFSRREVELKGYESPSTAWAISFDGLREFLRRYDR